MADATVVVGSPRSITIADREFPVAADSDAELDIGGEVNTVVPTGSGQSIITQARSNWILANIEVVISEDRGDLGFLAGLFNEFVAPLAAGLPGSPDISIEAPPSGPDREFLRKVIERAKFWPVTATLQDGTTYAGQGTITSRIAVDAQTGTATLSLEGNGTMVKQ
jgi:hypothetical protein